MKRACICDICICGYHRCVRRATALYGKDNEGCGVSEYTEKYPTYQKWRPTKSLKPKPTDRSNLGQMEGTTTFRADYVPYEITRRPGRQQAEYHPPQEGPIESATTYKQDYGSHKVQPLVRQRPKERARGATGKLDTIPTYKEDYVQWDTGRTESLKPKTAYNPPTERFGNPSTFQDDYVPRRISLSKSFKPPNAPQQHDDPFSGETTHQVSYVPHLLDTHFVKAPRSYKPSDQPFDSLTTHRHDYQGLRGSKPKSFKPGRGKTTSDTPFQGSTEFTDSYQPWAVSAPLLHKAAEYITPEGTMDMNTTTHTTYVKHHVKPFTSAKPFAKPACSTTPFDGRTTTKDDYQPWKPQRQALIRKDQEIDKPKGKMEGLSTFRDHYVPHQLQHNPSCKPHAAPLRSGTPMEDSTCYRSEYTPKKTCRCPASYDPPPGFIFDLVDEAGHRYFRRVTVPAAFKVEAPRPVAVMA